MIAIAGAAMPMIIGAAGLATDTIQWTLWKRQLQRTADSAAIAGVYNREAEGSTAFTQAAVEHDVGVNRHMSPPLAGTPVVTYPADSGVMRNQVNVVLTVQQRLPFSAFFLASPPVIRATARAASLPAGGDACMQALETGSTTGLLFSGNSDIHMPDCDMFSNSTGTNVSVAKGSSRVDANTVGGVGGIQRSNNFHVTAYRPYSPALPDPFAGVTPDPAAMVCTSAEISHSTNFAALPAGTNCFSGIDVNSNKTVTVPDNFGPIYINGGGVNVQGTFSCTGCTIVLTNKTGSSPIGNITMNGNDGSKLNITAPTSGTFRGIAIYQDRRATDCSNCNKINGNSNSLITGAMYFPSQELKYNGSGTANATCTMFVARRLDFTGNSSVSNKFKRLSDCAAAGLPSNATIRMVRLVG